MIPCQFDLMHTHCDQGWICPAAVADPYGVHVIHGANDMFDEGKSFYPIYKMYLEANITGDKKDDDKLFRELVKKTKYSYLPIFEQKGNGGSKCWGTLNNLLFKNIR